jgi:hypothetical protein
MKLNFIRFFALAAGISIFYVSCKKGQTTPVAQADYKALSSNIALSLYQSLTGKYGAASVNNGIEAPSNVGATNSGKTLFSVTPSCGAIVQTPYSYNIVAHDTTGTTSGTLKFTYTCSTNNVDGYIVREADTTLLGNAKFSSNIIVVQEYTVKALDQTYKLVSMDGNINVHTIYSVLDGPSYSFVGSQVTTDKQTLTSKYALAGLNVDLSTGVADVTKGIATFTTTSVLTDIDNPSGKTMVYKGTIAFLGGHKATLTFTATGSSTVYVYTVDLLTKVVTAG